MFALQRLEDRSLLERLNAHLEHGWHKLSKDARERLRLLAVSTGVSVTSTNHRMLVEGLSELCDSEAEAEFARVYLSNRDVAESVAKTGKPRAKRRNRPTGKGAGEPERLRVMAEHPVIAIDGEGVTESDGRHLYRYMAAVDSHGVVLAELDRKEGISTSEALRFVDDLPTHDHHGLMYQGIFGFGLGYDITKWLEQLKDEELYRLYHWADPDRWPVKYGRYRLRVLGKALVVAVKRRGQKQRRIRIWDLLPAFQSSFVKALEAWGVGSADELRELQKMKDQRGDFIETPWEQVKAYCRDECRLLALLVQRYLQAHAEAGLDLRGKFFGAGSTGEAVLRLMDAEHRKASRELFDGGELEDYRARAKNWGQAFFGGRSEISRLGLIEGPLHTHDLASAYPAALAALPCLSHGYWRRAEGEKETRKALDEGRLVCVHFAIGGEVEPAQGAEVERRARYTGIEGSGLGTRAWGYLPYRTRHGSIVFGETHPGGWCWSVEVNEAMKQTDRVELLGGWVYLPKCDCERPFAAVEAFYVRRLEWGKEGRGIVLKLGLNSCYGKFAQVVGKKPKYSCRVIAGWITSSTRARLLQAIGAAKDPWNVVYIATDGIIATEALQADHGPENSTKLPAQRHGKMMLGAWEHDVKEDTLFLLQPGFYFYVHAPDDQVVRKRLIKTRGTPMGEILARRQQIAEQWLKRPMQPPKGIEPRSVFRGPRTSILPPSKTNPEYRRKPTYGRWVKEERRIEYVVNPKRARVLDEEGYRLVTWRLSMALPESAEYDRDRKSYEALIAEEIEAMRAEQPDYVSDDGLDVGE